MAEVTHVLAHVRQRLDALTYDGHSQYLLSSIPVVSPFQPPVVQTSRRRRSLCNAILWYTGLTSFYFRLVLLLGTGWFLAIVGTSTYWYALPAAQTDLAFNYTPAQVIVLLGVNFLGGGLGCILAGVTADHYGRRSIFLSALGFWVLMNALTADAWNYASLLTFRLLAGMGIGGQISILAILALEYSPTRTRGTVTVLSVSFAGVGVVATVLYGHLMTTEKGLRWRLMHLVLSAIALSVVTLFFVALKESPKYLASIGQTDEALCALTAIEAAHGISRPVRVTVPTSLYEPPSQRPLSTYDRYLTSLDSTSTVDYEAPHETQPSTCHLDETSACVSTDPKPMVAWTLPSDPSGLTAYPCASDAHASFRKALTHRISVLGSPPMARRTWVIWFFWFAAFLGYSGAIMTTSFMARTFLQTTTKSMDFKLIDQLVWSFLLFPGCLLTAGMIERLGRRVVLGLFVAGSGTVMVTCAWVLHEDGQWLYFSVALGTLMVTTGGTLGALLPFTSEQFPLVTRALGISSTIAWGHFGTFTGVYYVLRHVMDDAHWTWQQSRWMLAICGLGVLGLFPLIFVMGPETQGRDIDAFELQEAQEGVSKRTREQSLAPSSGLDRVSHQLNMSRECVEKEEASVNHVHFWKSKLRSNRKRGRSEAQRELLKNEFDEVATLDMKHVVHERSSIEEKASSRSAVVDILEPILMDWRISCSSLYSDLDLPYSVNEETGRYTINLDMFDTFTYISTPVLGGDNCADHEQQTDSRVSASSSGQ